jgi:hypothetical protein
MNKIAYHLWSVSRDENILRTALMICVALAGISYLAAGLNYVPDAGRYSEQMWLSVDGRLP